jgi:2-oxoglutarate ferredoxin oxidoreductase subunit alpha
MRGGPGLGGIQPSQADYYQITKGVGHGDYHIIVLAPSTVQEMADCVTRAFDLADKYRMPAVVLADGLLGQMMEPVAFDDAEIVMSDASGKPWAANGHKNSRKHNIINSLYLQAPELEDKIRARYERYKQVEENETRAVADYCEDADIVVVAYGSTARLAKSAVDEARKQGIKAGVFRPVTLYPFPVKELNDAVKNAKKVLTVEMSMGQMIDDVKLAINCSRPVEFFGRTGGVIPAPSEILAKIKDMGGNE